MLGIFRGKASGDEGVHGCGRERAKRRLRALIARVRSVYEPNLTRREGLLLFMKLTAVLVGHAEAAPKDLSRVRDAGERRAGDVCVCLPRVWISPYLRV